MTGTLARNACPSHSRGAFAAAMIFGATALGPIEANDLKEPEATLKGVSDTKCCRLVSAHGTRDCR